MLSSLGDLGFYLALVQLPNSAVGGLGLGLALRAVVHQGNLFLMPS